MSENERETVTTTETEKSVEKPALHDPAEEKRVDPQPTVEKTETVETTTDRDAS